MNVNEIQIVFESIETQNYIMPSVTNLVKEYKNLKKEVDDLGHDSFLKFASEVENWQNNRFSNELFKDGFCDLPLDLIQELLYQEDMEWGGTWHSVLDYMHFEIPKSKVVDYLDNENE